jgi:hypothetical protein
MNAPCREFRASLERHLTGEPSPASLTSLGWHEHLLGCAACRDLLAVEEALEYLLASLPDPQLPDHLVPRVLTRLRETREEAQRSAARLDHLLETGDASAVGSPNTAPQENLAGSVLAGLALDRLLERQPSEPVPVGLAERTLAGLAAGRQRLAIQARQEAALDRLLDRVPAPTPPAGLVTLVLDELDGERFGAQPLERATPLRLVRSPLGASLAAAALLAALALSLWGGALLGAGDTDQERNLAESGDGAEGPAPTETLVQPSEDNTELAVEERDATPVTEDPAFTAPVMRSGTETAAVQPELPPSEPTLAGDLPDEELLAALDLLDVENWELFYGNEDVDLLLSAFDVSDELLLEIDALAPMEAEAPDEGTEDDRQG